MRMTIFAAALFVGIAASAEPQFAIANGVLTDVQLNGATEVIIPGGVTSIGDWAFYDDCYGMTSVTIPNSVTNIGRCAFWGSFTLKNVTIGDGVTSIGDQAFNYCHSIASFSVTEGNPAYSSTSGLLLTKDGKTIVAGVNGHVVIPDSVTNIGEDAFHGCYGLTSIAIRGNVTSIGFFAFAYCYFLTNVTIGGSVMDIGAYAFTGCSRLTSVTIGGSVTNIEWEAFSGCSGMTNVTLRGDAPIVGDNAFYNVDGGCVVRIPRTAKGYEIVYGKWQGMKVEYYDLETGGAAVSVGGAAVEFALAADGRTRTAAVAEGTKTEDIKIIVGGVDVTAGYRVSVEGTTAMVVLKSPFEQTCETGGASGTPRPPGRKLQPAAKRDISLAQTARIWHTICLSSQ